MDLRRRVKYKLARISEEDEEEESGEETAMMSDAFDDDQDSDTNMADHAPDVVSGLTEDAGHNDDDSPTMPPINGIVQSESTPSNETSPSVSIVDRQDDTTPPAGRGDANRDGGLTPSTPPPDYKDPPSYNECMKLSSVDVSKEKHKEDDAENLEWDQDQSVEPHIMVNPLDNSFDTELEDQHDGENEAIEMSDMAGEPSRSPEIMETTLIVPSRSDVIDQGYEMHDQRSWELPEMESQDQPQSSWLDIFHRRLNEVNSRQLLIMVFSVLIAVVAVLIIVLLPLSFSYLEYYEIGLREQRSTGRIFFDESVFEAGRHAIGPDYTFKKYPSWATNVFLEKVDVTTTSGLAISFSCSFQYFIREGELGLLEQRFDLGYHDIIQFVAKAAIKNVAASTSLDMYVERRRDVEIAFHEALRTKLGGNCCPDMEKCLLDNTCHLCSNSTVDCNQGYNVDIPYFQLLTINLPDVIINNNLEVQLMKEQAEMELYIQMEVLTRKHIEKSTAEISNLASEVLTNGTAAANLILSLGEAEARARIEAANSRGLALMYDRMSVITDQHKASLHWLRTLGNHEMLVMGVSFEEYLQLMKNYTV